MPNVSKHTTNARLSAKLKPIAKSSISDEIVEQIMSLIAKGELRPGQHLPSERELCKNFGAGRSSIREALRCLCIVGVLTARVGEGTSVSLDGTRFIGNLVRWRVVTEQHDIEDLMEIRMALEAVTAANAARRADTETLGNLKDLLERMSKCTHDQRRFAALDLEFHMTLTRASKNPLIMDLISTVRSQLERTVNRVLELPNARPRSHEEHMLIVKAIEDGDPEAARQAMQNHLSSAINRFHGSVGELPIEAPSRKEPKPNTRKVAAKQSRPRLRR